MFLLLLLLLITRSLNYFRWKPTYTTYMYLFISKLFGGAWTNIVGITNCSDT